MNTQETVVSARIDVDDGLRGSYRYDLDCVHCRDVIDFLDIYPVSTLRA
jgi:hypothetical protein